MIEYDFVVVQMKKINACTLTMHDAAGGVHCDGKNYNTSRKCICCQLHINKTHKSKVTLKVHLNGSKPRLKIVHHPQ